MRLPRSSCFRLCAIASLSWLGEASAAPPARDGDRLLVELSRDSAHAGVLADSLAKARAALARARAMDQSGDGTHAALMRAVAREWLDGARDLLRAADAEEKASRAQQSLDDLQTKTVRGRALLEETVARRGRARSLLEQLESEAKASTPAPASAAPKGKTPKAAKTPSSKPDASGAGKPPTVNE